MGTTRPPAGTVTQIVPRPSRPRAAARAARGRSPPLEVIPAVFPGRGARLDALVGKPEGGVREIAESGAVGARGEEELLRAERGPPAELAAVQAEEAAVEGRAAEQQGNAVMYARQNERDGSRREALLRPAAPRRPRAAAASKPSARAIRSRRNAGRSVRGPRADRPAPADGERRRACVPDDGAQGDAGDQARASSVVHIQFMISSLSLAHKRPGVQCKESGKKIAARRRGA